MKYSELKKVDIDLIKTLYKNTPSREIAQEAIASYFDIATRTVRDWVKRLSILSPNEPPKEPRIMIYDIETSLVKAWLFWTGEQYIRHDQLIGVPKIISVCYKWYGEEKVHKLTWDDGDDKVLVQDFVKAYNSADMVVGINNNSFDNKIVTARAMKYDLFINTQMKSFDVQRKFRSLIKIPSYSMAYLTKYFGVENKLEHEGRIMWQLIQEGTPEEKVEYLKKMVDYNVGDIVSTEALYAKYKKYMKHVIHQGVLKGGEKWSCPECGNTKTIEHVRTTSTPAGTIQHQMMCKVDKTLFKMSHRQYMEYIHTLELSIPE